MENQYCENKVYRLKEEYQKEKLPQTIHVFASVFREELGEDGLSYQVKYLMYHDLKEYTIPEAAVNKFYDEVVIP